MSQFDLVPARWRVAVFPNQLSTQIETGENRKKSHLLADEVSAMLELTSTMSIFFEEEAVAARRLKLDMLNELVTRSLAAALESI